jgi:hypothetical protein
VRLWTVLPAKAGHSRTYRAVAPVVGEKFVVDPRKAGVSQVLGDEPAHHVVAGDEFDLRAVGGAYDRSSPSVGEFGHDEGLAFGGVIVVVRGYGQEGLDRPGVDEVDAAGGITEVGGIRRQV